MSKALATLQRVYDWLRGHDQDHSADIVTGLYSKIEREEAETEHTLFIAVNESGRFRTYGGGSTGNIDQASLGTRVLADLWAKQGWIIKPVEVSIHE